VQIRNGPQSELGTVELSQKAGWAAVWFLTSASAGLFVLAIIAPKVSRLGHYTLPEMIRNFYGRRAERTAAFMIPFAWLGIIAVQIIAGAKVLSGLGIMSYSGSAWLCGVVFTLYTLLGGQKSILKSDFVQALIILAGVVVLFVLRRKACAGDNFPQLSPSTLFNEDFSAMDLFFLLVTYSVTFVVGPDIYSRIFCARDGKVARKSVILTALLIIPVAYMLTFLGITAGHDIPPANENGFILPGTSFLPPWALGLLVAALLSAVMSSADTTLLTSSLILAELVTGNLDKKRVFQYHPGDYSRDGMSLHPDRPESHLHPECLSHLPLLLFRSIHHSGHRRNRRLEGEPSPGICCNNPRRHNNAGRKNRHGKFSVAEAP